MDFGKNTRDKYFQQVEGVYEDKLEGSLEEKSLTGRLHDSEQVRERNRMRVQAFKAAQNHASAIAGTVGRVSDSMGEDYAEEVEGLLLKNRGDRDKTENIIENTVMRSRIVEEAVEEYKGFHEGEYTEEDVDEYRDTVAGRVTNMKPAEVVERFAEIRGIEEVEAGDEDSVDDDELDTARRQSLVEARIDDTERSRKENGRLAEFEELSDKRKASIKAEVMGMEDDEVEKRVTERREKRRDDLLEYMKETRKQELLDEGELKQGQDLSEDQIEVYEEQVAEFTDAEVDAIIAKLGDEISATGGESEEEVYSRIQQNRLDEAVDAEVGVTVDYGEKVRDRNENRAENFKPLAEDDRKALHVAAEQLDEEAGLGNGVQDAQETYSSEESDADVRSRARESVIRSKTLLKIVEDMKEDIPDEGPLPTKEETEAREKELERRKDELKKMSGEELEEYARDTLDMSREELDTMAAERVNALRKEGRGILQKRRKAADKARRDIDAPTEDEMGFSVFEEEFRARNTERSPLRTSKEGATRGGLLDETPRTGKGAGVREKSLDEARRFKGQRGADEGLRSLDGVTSSRNIDRGFKGQGREGGLTSTRNEAMVFGTNEETGEEEVQSAELQGPAAERQSDLVASLVSRIEVLEQKTRNMAGF